MIEYHLKLEPGQTRVTPEQLAEARRFAAARFQRHLSTEPVDEPAVERWVGQAYELAQAPPPKQLCWLDGPLQLVVALAPLDVWASVWNQYRLKSGLRDKVWSWWWRRVWNGRMWAGLVANLQASLWESVRASMQTQPTTGHAIDAGVQAYRPGVSFLSAKSNVPDN